MPGALINLYTSSESESDGVEDEPCIEVSHQSLNLPPLMVETKSETSKDESALSFWWSHHFAPGGRDEHVYKAVKARRLSTREVKTPSYLEQDYVGFERCLAGHNYMTWKAEMHEKDKKRVLDHAMPLLSPAVDAERKRVRLMQQ